MSLIRKILLILGTITLLEALLVSLPKTVDATCSTTWGCSPNCVVLDCRWIPSGGYGYCANGTLGDVVSLNCGAPGTYGGTYYECGAVWVDGVEANCNRYGADENACVNGSADGK